MTNAPASKLTYLSALVDGGGTVPPELGAIRRLVARGHDVTVLAEDSVQEEVRASGATFRPWVEAPNRPDRKAENDPYRDWEIKSVFKLFDRLLDTQFVGPAARYIADVNVAVSERRPDVVLCSQFAYGAMIAAEAAGIPFVVLMPNAYLMPAKGMPPFGIGLKPARGLAGRVRDRVIGGVTGRMWDKGLGRLNDLRAGVGLAPVDHFFDQVHQAARELIMTSAAFDFPATLPSQARYVGAVLDDPSWARPWTPTDTGRPLVLVGLSSTFQNQADCLQRIADALGSLPVQGLITTGPALDPSMVRPPANVEVVASAPHAEVLRHASAVVNHGGHGTVVKALAAGVPMVVMHHGRDQADNAARVTARGAGIAVKRTATPATIAAAVRRLLDEPSFRDSAARLGTSIRDDSASDALVSDLESVATLVR